MEYSLGPGLSQLRGLDWLCVGAVATFGTQLGSNLSTSEMSGLLNGSATQSQLDMFASRAGELSHSRWTVLSVWDVAVGFQLRLLHVGRIHCMSVFSAGFAPSLLTSLCMSC